MFGVAAPPAALIIGGAVVGLGATLAVSEFLDWGQTKVFHAYLNRYSPRDKMHIQFTGMSKLKKTGKAVRYGNLFWWIGKAVDIAGDVVMMQKMGDFDFGALGEMQFEDDERDYVQEFTVAIWPHVLTVLMDDDTGALAMPYLPVLDGFPGFEQEGEVLIMRRAGAEVFAERWAQGNFPELKGPVAFGDLTVSGWLPGEEEETELEEPVTLFNPFHDRLGRFAPRPTNTGALTKDAARIVGRVETRLSHMPDELDVQTHENKASATEALGKFSSNGLAAFHNGQIHVTPRGQKAFKKNPRLRDHAFTHEAVHGRLRANGEHARMSTRLQASFEEGSTDLMAAALNRSPDLIAYRGYSASVATWARSQARSQKKAWQLISDTHYNNHDPGNAPSLGIGRPGDIEWLMQDIPRHMEEDDGLEEWVESERAKWEHLYGLPAAEESADSEGDDTEAGGAARGEAGDE